MHFTKVLLVLLCGYKAHVVAQKVQPEVDKPPAWAMQDSGCEASLRGLHVVSNNVVWASGSEGTVLRTVDGGQNWKRFKVEGAEKLDFRDIHAFDQDRAVILNAGQPARVYRTEDGGQSWLLAFEHPHEKSFFDALSFWDDNHGIAMSDPIDEGVLLIQTKDGGKTWNELPPKSRPRSTRGEGGFAASGTNMVLLANGHCLIGLGSALEGEQFKSSRIVLSEDRGTTWTDVEVPMARNQSSGIFSLAFANNRMGVAVGGNYLKPEDASSNIAVSSDGGKTWKRPDGKPPREFRSGVAALKREGKTIFVAVGPGGTDWSSDGNSWSPVSDEGFHAIQFTTDGNAGWATGVNGRIAKWLR